MKQGIYHYSPILQFDVGGIGQATANLSTYNPALYVPYLLHQSNGQQGITLYYYITDENSSINDNTVGYKGKFSYDVLLTHPNVYNIYLYYPSGSKEKFVYDATLGHYKSLVD
ncbi:MAG: hypothetical protein MR270_07115 [Erysipelotrichaceae bacterium]|nr:hypothetical protein [Erysipelotrichaceae bacterium]